MESKCKDYNCIWWTPWAYNCAICAIPSKNSPENFKNSKIWK